MLKKIYVYVAIMLVGGFLAACSDADVNDTDEGAEKVVPVETHQAEKGDLTITKTVYGRAEPSSTTPIMLQSAGEIDTLEVADGDDVEEDDTIATVVSQMGTKSIKAPADGIITNLDAEEGTVASTEEPLAVIAAMDTMKLNFNVTSNVRSLFDKDDENRIVVQDKDYNATITRIKETPDDTGLYPVEADVKNKANDILPGMVAQMEVPEKRVKDTILLPTAAIVTEEGESFIFIVQDKKAVKINVTVTETQSDTTAIDGDVNEGDEIVVNGQLTLVDGSEIDVRNEENES